MWDKWSKIPTKPTTQNVWDKWSKIPRKPKGKLLFRKSSQILVQAMFPAHFQLVHSVQARLKRAGSLKVAYMGQIPLICFSYKYGFWRNFEPFIRTFWVVGGFYFEDLLFSHNLIILLVEAIPKCNFKSENFFILYFVACQS